MLDVRLHDLRAQKIEAPQVQLKLQGSSSFSSQKCADRVPRPQITSRSEAQRPGS
jgi:hypothetical protein